MISQRREKMLTPLLGNAASVIFAAALLLAGISSSITAGMAGGTIFSGIFNKPYEIKSKETRWGILLTMIPAAAVILLIDSPFQAFSYSQMFLGMQLPITVFTQIYLTSRKVMGKYANSLRLKIALFAIAVIVDTAEYRAVVCAVKRMRNKKEVRCADP